MNTDATTQDLDSEIVEFVNEARDTVMDTEAFIAFVHEVCLMARTYAKASLYLGGTPPTVRRVDIGGDSDVLRRSLNIKRSDRKRACFEATDETLHNIRVLMVETGMVRQDLLEEMIETMFEKLEGGFNYG